MGPTLHSHLNVTRSHTQTRETLLTAIFVFAYEKKDVLPLDLLK